MLKSRSHCEFKVFYVIAVFWVERFGKDKLQRSHRRYPLKGYARAVSLYVFLAYRVFVIFIGNVAIVKKQSPAQFLAIDDRKDQIR